MPQINTDTFPVPKSGKKQMEIAIWPAKFLIGFVAGASAVAAPRIVTFLGSGVGEDAVFYSPTYVSVAVVFGVLMGMWAVIFEFRIPRHPKDTFFSALAIPGLLAGSLATNVESIGAKQSVEEKRQLTEEVLNSRKIKVETPEVVGIVPLDDETAEQAGTNADSLSFNIHLISPASAEDLPVAVLDKPGNHLNVEWEKRGYAVSLGFFNEKASAVLAARAYKMVEPGVTLLQTAEGFEILSDRRLMTRSEATLNAVKLAAEYKLTTKILQIR